MGFQISRLTDFAKEFSFPCLAFVQLNRQNDISQSDRLRWLCHSYSTLAVKTATEMADDGPENGNRKVVVMDTRFGPGIEERDYICFNFQRNINKITEIGLRSRLNLAENNENNGNLIETNGNENNNNDDTESVPW